jgi:hypothetical protein
MELGCNVAAEVLRLVLGADDVDMDTVVDGLTCQAAVEAPELALGADIMEVAGAVFANPLLERALGMLEAMLSLRLVVLAAGAATVNATGTGTGAGKMSVPETTAIGAREAKAGVRTTALTMGAGTSGAASKI